jgi:thiol-disulfide isomerase/thioredoxin
MSHLGPWRSLVLLSAMSILCVSTMMASSSFFVGAAAAAETPVTKDSNTPPTKSENELDVIQLTSRNFSRTLSSHRDKVWLIEFYSPQCVHCVEFAPTYNDMARIYHGDDTKYNIQVAKVNGEVERALTSRFGIYAYPSFFLVDGFSVYQFDQPRMRNMLMAFAEGGYKKTAPIPFYSSPMGPMGLAQGLLIFCGLLMHDLFQWTQSAFGLSPLLVCMMLFGSIFLGCFFCIVILALAIPPRVKRD